jgi:diacylglycerol kinase family enzyme
MLCSILRGSWEGAGPAAGADDGAARWKTVRIIIDGKDDYQLDGDVVGESTTLFAEIQPGALVICVPTHATNEPQQ